ncbi:putative Isochorismatase family [Trypanosoma vivax]|uniref:nicotinamidase n=1 Tax=Trypanosoma vivax (strain Y486) TaxID=1055687 RepID=G0U214_TRYVY|nr:putative pyrazinamidase/nicotinamidase [Trypanosoma vivax]KAH8618796.1 putative Isochorismatase family [Trypanosoma vivax]CCC50317.1 putative pyrazinamidase/nicotinamidase [Trypanosoma vivax Y486]
MTSKLEISPHHDALLIVDVQNDFVQPNGALAVPEGPEVVPVINHISSTYTFRAVVASKDWHPLNHISFRNEDGTGGTWPPHCQQSTKGAKLHPDLRQEKLTHIVHKATLADADSYSVFGDDSGRTTGLTEMLKGMGVRRLFICGLAYDFCVYHTSLDAARAGFEVFVLEDAVRAVFPDKMPEKRTHLRQEGVQLVTSFDLSCP